MTTPDLHVDLERIKADILALSSIGRNERDRGIYRMAFTKEDMEGKGWLLHRIEENGLVGASDGAANISGVLPGRKEYPRIFAGSHIDTVPCAGMLDGTLGVVVALECMRVMKAAGMELEYTTELIA
ncbi:MAG: M28 family peptidase [Verrucomicrobiota bacterium]